jgi:hypothetical protein
MVPVTLVALWILRRDGAEWYAVPAIWPATQFYYVSTALPAISGRRLLAALAAAPVPLMIPAMVIVLAGRRVWLDRRAVTPAAGARSLRHGHDRGR